MSTRSCIARPRQGSGWEGVYCHSDGYPAGVGQIVWRLMKERYQFRAHRFWHELIDNNLDGWSSLNCWHPQWGKADPAAWDGRSKLGVDGRHTAYTLAKEGYADPYDYYPTSYQNDPGRACDNNHPPISSDDPDPLYIEWVYVVEADGLRVLAQQRCSKLDDGAVAYNGCAYRYVIAGFFAWTGGEPVWEKIGAMTPTTNTIMEAVWNA